MCNSLCCEQVQRSWAAQKNAGLFTVRRLGFCDQNGILFIQFIQRGFTAETDLAAALFDVDDLHRQVVAFLADVRDLLDAIVCHFGDMEPTVRSLPTTLRSTEAVFPPKSAS